MEKDLYLIPVKWNQQGICYRILLGNITFNSLTIITYNRNEKNLKLLLCRMMNWSENIVSLSKLYHHYMDSNNYP